MSARSSTLRGYARKASVESSVWYVGHLFSFLAEASDTAGQFALVEILGRKGGEPPHHIHRREDEAFYVLEGTITFYVGDEVFVAEPGTFVFLPRDLAHSFTFETDVIRMLSILAPANVEYFKHPAFSPPAQAMTLPPMEGPPDVAGLTALLGQHGIEVVGPPGPPR